MGAGRTPGSNALCYAGRTCCLGGKSHMSQGSVPGPNYLSLAEGNPPRAARRGGLEGALLEPPCLAAAPAPLHPLLSGVTSFLCPPLPSSPCGHESTPLGTLTPPCLCVCCLFAFLERQLSQGGSSRSPLLSLPWWTLPLQRHTGSSPAPLPLPEAPVRCSVSRARIVTL